MRKAIALWVFVAMASILSPSSLVFAEGKGQGQSVKPPGWEKEKKKGWKGEVPPGIEKKGGEIPPGLSKEDEGEGKGGNLLDGAAARKKGGKVPTSHRALHLRGKKRGNQRRNSGGRPRRSTGGWRMARSYAWSWTCSSGIATDGCQGVGESRDGKSVTVSGELVRFQGGGRKQTREEVLQCPPT